MSENNSSLSGWLWKWTNYVKGYQKRWFVLSNGLLSYYKSQAEVTLACRGTVILAGATIETEDACHFTISNGSSHRYHLKANSEVERQKWITALELAKTLSKDMLDSDDEDVDDDDYSSYDDESTKGDDSKEKKMLSIRDVGTTVSTLSAKLDDLKTYQGLISKHGAALQQALTEFEDLDKSLRSSPKQVLKPGSCDAVLIKLKNANERGMLFRITSHAMIGACAEYLQMTKSLNKKWQHEHEQRVRLQETVETLAKQHNCLEKALHAGTGPPSNDDQNVSLQRVSNTKDNLSESTDLETSSNHSSDGSDDEFMDAYDDVPKDNYTIEVVEKSHVKTLSQSNDTTFAQEQQTQNSSKNSANQLVISSTTAEEGTIQKLKKKHRTNIPFKPNYSLNLWSIMKNCIGKDLSKIPMPINFNEPLSLLQRLSEDMEYSKILDKAAMCKDSCEQMAHVMAFSVSSYSTTVYRIGKPFNPLLGETFESDSTDDFGYKLIAEQVSHHPPAAAMHADSTSSAHGGWSFWTEITLSSKFRGKYLSLTPLGTVHILFHESGNHYTWKKITTTVHNIIVGKLWVDQVSGVVTDKHNNPHYVVSGTWDSYMEYAKIISVNNTNRSKPVYKTLPAVKIWQKYPLPPQAENMYYMSSLALTLNEPLDGTAPTDSRLRPDQRKMENREWDEANLIKQQLEEMQRNRRKKKELEDAKLKNQNKHPCPYRPAWFKKSKCSLTNEDIYTYNKQYWQCKEKQDWSRCLSIFDISSTPETSNNKDRAQTSSVR